MQEKPWVTLKALVDQLVNEDLLKFRFGDAVVTLPLPIQFLDELDLFGNFRLQDPMGLGASGSGEVGRYYYVKKLNIDFMRGKIDVTAVDLQFLLRQYFMLGDETVQAAAWASATEADRMYGYLCDETSGQFADGEPGKILVDENILEDYGP